jgi:hypothetical protein
MKPRTSDLMRLHGFGGFMLRLALPAAPRCLTVLLARPVAIWVSGSRGTEIPKLMR